MTSILNQLNFIDCQKSADMNNSSGIFQVGFCYYHGIGVEMDKHQAFVHYRKLAEMNNSYGIFKTAICYYYGIGVEKNINKYFVLSKSMKKIYSKFFCNI